MIDYDEENDILFLYRHKAVSSSVRYASFIFDLDKQKNISSMELLGASRLLKENGLTKENLSKLSSAKIRSYMSKDGFIYFYFMLTYPVDNTQKAVTSGPIPVPI